MSRFLSCCYSTGKFTNDGEMATLRVPAIVPSPANDCEKLKKAFQGWGTDEKAIITILGHRNANQRKKIRETYEQLYSRSLIADLDSELSSHFGKAVILWTYDPAERDARLANEALQTKSTGIQYLYPIIEIACASSPHHLIAVRQVYCSLYDCSLEEDIESAIPCPLGKILVGLVSAYRYDKQRVSTDAADAEAALLHRAIEKKQLDHDNVLWILGTRNVFQLRATFERYKQKYGNPFDEDIKKCGTDDLESLLRVVICCLDTPEKHFAQVIGDSIIGFGTDEDSLTRAIVTRAEIDMMNIRGEYFTTYNTSMDNAVIGDTSGDYKKFLMTLLGAKV